MVKEKMTDNLKAENALLVTQNTVLRDTIVNFCRVIDRIEIIEGIDDFGQLAIGVELTAELLTARNIAKQALFTNNEKITTRIKEYWVPTQK